MNAPPPEPISGIEDHLAKHHEDGFGWAMACCGWDRSEAEEVLQASYLKVLEGQAVFAGRSAFRTWLFAVIRRTAGERRRRATRRRILALGLHAGDDTSETPVPERSVERSRKTRRLLAGLAALPRRQREVLHLVFYHDLTLAESADVLGIAIGSARQHYARGKDGLRRRLVEEDTP